MKISTFFFILATFSFSGIICAQTSWVGSQNNNWNVAGNWSQGIPEEADDVVIGDSYFTGPHHPIIRQNTSFKSLTLGTGAVTVELTQNRNINLKGDLLIGNNGTLNQSSGTSITLEGDWHNQGTYQGLGANSQVTFSGGTQYISGNTTFRSLTINNGSTLVLQDDIMVNHELQVNGILNPGELYIVNSSGILTANPGAVLKVLAVSFTDNYNLSGTVRLDGRSIVDYASSTLDQIIANTISYGYLRISGGSTKTLQGSLPPLQSAQAIYGRIIIDDGILDLQDFTAHRGNTTTGGAFILAAHAILKIGGTQAFPQNYHEINLSPTSLVNYNGTQQTISGLTYGNLTLSSSSGDVEKTMPDAPLIVAGNFHITKGEGTSVQFNAGNDITVSRNFYMDGDCTFNAGSFNHTFRGNWSNEGSFIGNTSSIIFSGTGSLLSGGGTHQLHNVSFTAQEITAGASSLLEVNGHIQTQGQGTFRHETGGNIKMQGSNKSINGNGFQLYNLTINENTLSAANISLAGNLIANAAFEHNQGTITFTGNDKTIEGPGPLTFHALNITGNILSHSGFSMLSNLSVAADASFTATGGTANFAGQSFLSGTAWLYNVAIAEEKTLTLGAESVLGIGNALGVEGTLDVSNTTPNTVNYYAEAPQTITAATYHNLVLSNGAEKTATGNIQVNRDFTLLEGAGFYAAGFHHTLNRHLINHGDFHAQSSTVTLAGSTNTHIIGETHFNELILNKADHAARVELLNNISAVTIHMTKGSMYTGIHSLTLSQSRTGSGIIIGTIIRTHPFAHGVEYAFESPQNAIRFTSPDGDIDSVIVKVSLGSILDFIPGKEAVNREYEITIPNGSYADATLRLHYENNELNAFMEQHLALYRHVSENQWDSIGVSNRNNELNYVEKEDVTTGIEGRWAMSGIRNIVQWNGLISSAWEDSENWTTLSGEDMTNRVPGATDAVYLGHETFLYQPIINSNPVVNAIQFGSAQSCSLTIENENTLQVLGSVTGFYPTPQIHFLKIGDAKLEVGTSLVLGDGSEDSGITLSIATGEVSILDDLVQDGAGSIVFTQAGSIALHGSFYFYSGAYTAHTGTFIYAGSTRQKVARAPYHNLVFDKTGGQATAEQSLFVAGNLSLINTGSFQVTDSLRVLGNIAIEAGATLQHNTTLPIIAHGNWHNLGSFEAEGGQVMICGTADQNISGGRFNTLVIHKTEGTATLTGDIILNSDLHIQKGSFDLTTFSARRANPGGTFSMGPQALLIIAGADNYPDNFNSKVVHKASTIEYSGTMAQHIKDLEYGNLVIRNGAENMKLVLDDISVHGDLIIHEGAIFCPGTFGINLFGNLINHGMIHPLDGTFILRGDNKELIGSMSVQNLTVMGSYHSNGELIQVEGDLLISPSGAFRLQNTAIKLSGNLTNRGILESNSTATFTGNRQQIIQLDNAVSSSSTGLIIFDGNIAPIFNSTSNPLFASVQIKNTAGIQTSVPWTVAIAMVVFPDAIFDGGSLTHTFNGHFINRGTVSSSGSMVFAPLYFPVNVALDEGTTFSSTGSIVLGGTQPMTISGETNTFQQVSVTSTYAGGITPHRSWTIVENLFINSGSVFNGGEALTHTLLGSLTNNGIFNGQSSTLLFAGDSTSIAGAGTTRLHNMILDETTDFHLHTNLQIEKDFTLNTTDFFTLGNGIIFSGTALSSINSSVGQVTFDYLESNKEQTGQTELLVPVFVRNDLVLNSGIFKSTDANILTLVHEAFAGPGNADSYVDGPMSKKGNDAFVFPLGNEGVWARMGISAPASEEAEFRAQYFAQAFTDSLNIEEPLQVISRVEYWVLDRIVGADETVSVTLFWENSNRSGVRDPDDLVVARYNGSKWVNHSQHDVSATVHRGFITSEPILQFSPFTLGSTSEANPLPVEFLYVSAEYKEPHAIIRWSTASEINNNYFSVERSADGKDFQLIEIIQGAGTSSAVLHYEATDLLPLPGVSYYRIKQTDFDGTWKHSHMVALNTVLATSEGGMQIYPNPARANNLGIALNNLQDEELLLSIYNVRGVRVHAQRIRIGPGENSIISPQIPSQLEPGHYFIRVSGSSVSYVKPVIIY